MYWAGMSSVERTERAKDNQRMTADLYVRNIIQEYGFFIYIGKKQVRLDLPQTPATSWVYCIPLPPRIQELSLNSPVTLVSLTRFPTYCSYRVFSNFKPKRVSRSLSTWYEVSSFFIHSLHVVRSL